MRQRFTDEEIQSYRSNGFLSIPDFLSAEELETWRAVVTGAVDSRQGERFATEVSNDVDDIDDPTRAYYQNVFSQHVNLWKTDSKMREIMFDPRLGEIACDLAGVRGIRIWHDQALIKRAYANYTAYHLDVPNWSFTSPDAISMWVALDDATLENGCLYYTPGSHKATSQKNAAIGPDLGAIFDIYPEFKETGATPCPVPAGGACFHNGLTIHGAGANMTAGLRRAMTCAYMPDGSTFNGQPNVLPPSYLHTLQVGDLLDDDEHNPLIFSRT